MHAAIFLSSAAVSALYFASGASALPQPATPVLAARQAVVTPPPCEAMDPAPSAEETEARFDEFANAFLVEQNLTHAFEFISSTYINHNPAVTENGPNAALDILGPIWGTMEITVLGTRYIDPQGFLNYNTSGFGTVVDRFRWEAGCIVEHWDAGEVFPGTNSTSSQIGSTGSNSSSTTTSGDADVALTSRARRSVEISTTKSQASTVLSIVVAGAFVFLF